MLTQVLDILQQIYMIQVMACLCVQKQATQANEIPTCISMNVLELRFHTHKQINLYLVCFRTANYSNIYKIYLTYFSPTF